MRVIIVVTGELSLARAAAARFVFEIKKEKG
jgi:hypothetical protein